MVADYNKRKSIKLPREMWDEIDDACKRFNCSLSEYIGAIVINYCEGNIFTDLDDFRSYMAEFKFIAHEKFCKSLMEDL